MLCLMPKPSPKTFPKQSEFLYGLHQAHTLTPLSTQYGAFLKKKVQYEWTRKKRQRIYDLLYTKIKPLKIPK